MDPAFKLTITGIRKHQDLQVVQHQLQALFINGDSIEIQAAIQRIFIG